MNKVPVDFPRFLNMVRNKAKVTTRELGNAINKSANYISLLENRKIKTIDFDVAYEMLKYINHKKAFINGNDVSNILIETFNIKPQNLIDEELEEVERLELLKIKEQELQSKKLKQLEELIDINNMEILDIAIKLCQPQFRNMDFYIEFKKLLDKYDDIKGDEFDEEKRD